MRKIIFIKILLCFVLFLNPSLSKVLQAKLITCADEIGPILEFNIPKFENNKMKVDFSFKVFETDNRNSFFQKKGIMYKKSSPIDDSYYFYQANSIEDKQDVNKIRFDFFPPSHLLIQKNNSPFEDLVCWNNENKKN